MIRRSSSRIRRDIGFILFAADAAATLIRFALNPAVTGRATAGSSVLLIGAGAGALGGLLLWAITAVRELFRGHH